MRSRSNNFIKVRRPIEMAVDSRGAGSTSWKLRSKVAEWLPSAVFYGATYQKTRSSRFLPGDFSAEPRLSRPKEGERKKADLREFFPSFARIKLVYKSCSYGRPSGQRKAGLYTTDLIHDSIFETDVRMFRQRETLSFFLSFFLLFLLFFKVAGNSETALLKITVSRYPSRFLFASGDLYGRA